MSSRFTLGTFNSLGSPHATEATALSGFDWVLIDLEHGAGNDSVLFAQSLAARVHGTKAIVRVETPDRIRCGRVLDMGADGVMLPRLESAQGVKEAIAHLKYPPHGDRGAAAYHSAAGYGLTMEHFDTADDEVLGVVQIETLGALEEIDSIAAIDGVDVLFIGPRDLAAALGVDGDTAAPAFQDAARRVVAAAQRHGIASGILVANAEAAVRYFDLGFTFLGVGSDASFIAQSSAGVIQAVHGALDHDPEPALVPGHSPAEEARPS